MIKNKADIIKLLEKILAFLQNDEPEQPKQPMPLLTGPCVAKIRAGNIVFAHRGNRIRYCFRYLNEDTFLTVSEDGKFLADKTAHDSDIVEVIRPLTEQEVLDWQFRGIEPNLNIPSEFVYNVIEGFEHSDIGRKKAEEMGLVYLGKARDEMDLEITGTLHFYDSISQQWESKDQNKQVLKYRVYAYKPT